MTNQAVAKILIADDEPLFLRTTAALLKKAGFQCVTASNGHAAIELLGRESFDLVLSDLNMPGNLRFELLQEGRKKWPDVPLIVITGAPSLPSAIESVRLGIADYLLKPVKYDDLLSAVRRALSNQHRRQASDSRTERGASSNRGFADLIGESPAMQELFEIIERVADTDASVLITGESGTGKEVVARAIHERSRRAGGPLQVIDCTAIPETLFESVLFGHAKGAFTGAVKDQTGLLEKADGGTAFFDEIGELPHPLQAKLLRVIQEQTFTPVGKTSAVKADMRFLCATNRDVELEVNAGRFRRDLFYRLAVIHIVLPPLRERGDDVLLLARHFLDQFQLQHRRVSDFSEESAALLRNYRWPGNIRELRNAVERGLTMARGEWIVPSDLPPAVRSDGTDAAPSSSNYSGVATRAETVDDAERDYLVSLLRENTGNVAKSARQAGISRQGLHKLLKKHGVDAADFRP